ncbi:MAG: proline--tRNA ligase [Candidatus Aenigmarchaeota archaeon]|nr:proline--tRNA ligase [Candidatus Aenigmarchaeota archaeon]
MADNKPEKKETQGITIRKNDDMSEWYNEVVLKGGMADFAPIGGCMIIKPHGYAVWERIQEILDKMLADSGHRNAYFPMFIPERFLKKEADHFEGFTPEVAWVEDEHERYAIRPTSETIIYDAYSKWLRSWRDLPILINQWCNIVRWETKVTKLFLRTREFLWQEGHTVHATEKEADAEVMKILEFYRKLSEDYLAIPVVTGKKSEAEKFAGAYYTTGIEGLMPDGKALQMGTSHNLGQHFSKVFDIKYLDKDGKEKRVWQTSWGVSTRLIGAMIMVHGDDKGLVLPPKIAPIHVAIVPIIFDKDKKKTFEECKKVRKKLSKSYSVHFDDRETYSAGWKFNEWEMKGVPIRIEIGPKDIANKQVMMVLRDTGEKKPVKMTDIEKSVKTELAAMQKRMFENAKKSLKDNTVEAMTYNDLKMAIAEKKMVHAFWCEDTGCEDKVKSDTAATTRVIPFEQKEKGKCIACGKKASKKVFFARAY